MSTERRQRRDDERWGVIDLRTLSSRIQSRHGRKKRKNLESEERSSSFHPDESAQAASL